MSRFTLSLATSARHVQKGAYFAQITSAAVGAQRDVVVLAPAPKPRRAQLSNLRKAVRA